MHLDLDLENVITSDTSVLRIKRMRTSYPDESRARRKRVESGSPFLDSSS